ncbi:MAG: hypothetical protein ACTSSF_00255 [Candidatus Heimdallarchaeaceae archaeon]
MHWAEKEVTSLELSRRLKELGFPQKEPGWFWVVYHDKDGDRVQLLLERERDKKFWQMLRNCNPSYREVIKAPTNSELGEWLPFYLPELGFLRIEKNEDGFDYYYDRLNITEWYAIEKIEANARAKMAIWLRENGYITFNQGG